MNKKPPNIKIPKLDINDDNNRFEIYKHINIPSNFLFRKYVMENYEQKIDNDSLLTNDDMIDWWLCSMDDIFEDPQMDKEYLSECNNIFKILEKKGIKPKMKSKKQKLSFNSNSKLSDNFLDLRTENTDKVYYLEVDNNGNVKLLSSGKCKNKKCIITNNEKIKLFYTNLPLDVQDSMGAKIGFPTQKKLKKWVNGKIKTQSLLK